MPTAVPIGIFCIGRTVVDKDEVDRWMKFIGANEFEIPPEETVSNPALLIALAGKRCYKSFEVGLNPNISRIRESYVDYFDNILASGHGSVLEHSVFNFAIENVSRVFTAEMNRHRAGWAISEGSLRFIRFGDNIPYWEPTSIKVNENDNPDLAWRKLQSRDIFREAFSGQEKSYRDLERIWTMDESHHNFHYKKVVTSMMRRIIGLGVATGGVWSGNIRALRHVMAMRSSPQAEEEILHVFSRITVMIKEKEPLLFGDFHQTEGEFWAPKYVKV